MSNPHPPKPPTRKGAHGPNQLQRFRRADAPPPITLTAPAARYRDILGAIWNLGGALTTAQIGAWLESPGKGHYGPLKALYQHGYLERRYLPTRAPGIGGGETVHVLTRKGAGVALGDAYDDVRDGEAIDRMSKRSPQTLEHQLAVAELRLLVELGVRSLDELDVAASLGDKDEPWLKLTVRLAPTRQSPKGHVTTRRPDGLVTLRQGSHQVTTLLEVDLDDTRPRKATRFLDRFHVYVRAMAEGVIESAAKGRPAARRSLAEQLHLGTARPGRWPAQVLFVTKTVARRDALREMAAGLLPVWHEQWKRNPRLARHAPPLLFCALEGLTHRWDAKLQDYVRGAEVDEHGKPKPILPHRQLMHAAQRLYHEPILVGLHGKPATFYS